VAAEAEIMEATKAREGGGWELTDLAVLEAERGEVGQPAKLIWPHHRLVQIEVRADQLKGPGIVDLEQKKKYLK
jgi:hypothetical protein